MFCKDFATMNCKRLSSSSSCEQPNDDDDQCVALGHQVCKNSSALSRGSESSKRVGMLASSMQRNWPTEEGVIAISSDEASRSSHVSEDSKPGLAILPLSEIQTLAEKPRPPPRPVTKSSKRPRSKSRVRKRNPISCTSKDRGGKIVVVQAPPISMALNNSPQSSSHSLVSEAIALAISRGLRSGYIEFLRSNTDDSIKNSFNEVKKELTNRQSFLKSATSVVRYLQAARILYNRLHWKKRRKYECAARDRVRMEHMSNLQNQGVIDDLPLFVNDAYEARVEKISATACHMPPSEHLFKDRRSLQDFKRYEDYKQRRIHCPICPIGSDYLTSAIHYQNHMLTHHSCAHMFACNFCGLVFLSLEALKAHDGCEQFATALVQRISSSGEVDYYMNFATMVMVCTDCGSQLLIRSTYIGDSSIAHWKDIVHFHMLHNAERMVPLIIFSPADFTVKMRLRIQTIFPAIKDVQVECPYCGKNEFNDTIALEEHFLSHDECLRKTCPECSSNFSQEAFYREHLLSHLGTKAGLLAVYLSRACTFITGGVPSCGPNLAAAGGLIYGGVSTAVFTSKLQLPYVDAWESVTVRKKSNRRGRKRRAGPMYRKDPDEVEEDLLFASDTSAKLKKLLGDSFDCENVLRVNSFFYTAINSKDETEESCEPFNSPDAEFESAIDEHFSETNDKLAEDLSRRFLRHCRLAGGKALTKKHNPSHRGLFSKVFMCRRCHYLCIGVKAVYAHLSRCCPEMRSSEKDSAPFDLEDGLLVFCVYAGNGVPNTRITCWECSATVCSVFGLRVHMIVHHGMFLKVEDEPSEVPDLICDDPAFFTATTRAVNKVIGLTESGCLPVNLEERRKEAQLAKLKSAQNTQVNTPAKVPLSSTSAVSPLSFLNRTQTPLVASTSETVFSSPPLVMLDEAPSPSVQFIGYSEPQSVQILYEKQMSPVHSITGPTEVNTGEQSFANVTNTARDNDGVSITKDADVHYDSGCSTDNFSQEETEGSVPAPQFVLSDPLLPTANKLDEFDIANNAAAHVIQADDELKVSLCEFCGLSLRSCVALSAHYRLHSEITSVCHLCDPADFTLGTPEMYLNHIHDKHTAPVEPGKEEDSDAVCTFCNFRVQKIHVFAHLLTDCYMAPCPLCGDKLSRRNDRITHKKAHKDVLERFICDCRRGFSHYNVFMEHECRSRTLPTITCALCGIKLFASSTNSRSVVLNDGVDHFIEKHTNDFSCSICKKEPLEALREHVMRHLTESTEEHTPKRSLSSCRNSDIFVDTIEENLCTEALKSSKERKRAKKGIMIESSPEQDTSETADASDSESAHSVPVEEATTEEETRVEAQEGPHIDDFNIAESGNSRDSSSPSVLEKQRQVLAEHLDDIGPPPSVMIIENETAVVREERDEPQSALPKSAVADDGEDDVLVIDETGEENNSHRPQSPAPVMSAASPVVHTINEGDEDCMMLDVVELPTGSVSHTVASTREKKYKCAMCSATFLREATCRIHEQNSHRNDIVSDICDEVYGIPLTMESFMYLCQQCAVAFEDPHRARKHLAQHMIKGPAFPCEKCSSICLTESNLREHHKKHDDGKLSYRCLKCSPNKMYYSESAMYYHLSIEHHVPMIAFCKNCLVASANMDRIFAHVITRECSGGNKGNLKASLQTLLRSLGFAIASELYYQPNDETLHKQILTKKGSFFATPTLCSHRTFITFGDAFTSCPEDPEKCHGLVNQNRWHSHLSATNRENPGEMPINMPEAVPMRNVENIINMLHSRFRLNEQSRQIAPAYSGSPSRSTNNTAAVFTNSANQSQASNHLQNVHVSTCAVVNRRQADISNSASTSMMTAPPQFQAYMSQSSGDMSAIRQALNEGPITLTTNQSACIFCRCRNVPMICEPPNRADEAVKSLCVKFGEIYPHAAQTLYKSLNSFIRETVNLRQGRARFCFCRWHYSQQCFNASGHHTNVPPSVIDSHLLITNYQKGLFYPDPAGVTVLTQMPLPPPCRTVVATPSGGLASAQPAILRCVVCDVVVPKGTCRAAAFRADYMLSVPLLPISLKEQWATHLSRFVTGVTAKKMLNAFRLTHPPRLCIRHFNPRTVMVSNTGALIRSPAFVGDLPMLDFSQFAALNTEFSQAQSRLLEGMEKEQNSETIARMLKIVQDLVKCSDERCGRQLNTCNDVLFHRFHELPHKFVCMECFSANDVIRTEQEMIEHFVAKHCQRNPGDANVQAIYSLHCPLRNCSAAFPSVQTLRKHINHLHSNQFPHSSDNCATRFFNTAKMTFHNGVHEKHSCDVTCCYLCGVADPWQREFNGVRISHELVHAMRRFIACKTCMAPMGQDPTGAMLIDHFMRQHMLDQPRRIRHCKVCRQNVIETGIAEHILEQHRLIAFRARYAPQTSMLSVMNGSEFCVYVGLPPDLCKPNPLADSTELG